MKEVLGKADDIRALMVKAVSAGVDLQKAELIVEQILKALDKTGVYGLTEYDLNNILKGETRPCDGYCQYDG